MTFKTFFLSEVARYPAFRLDLLLFFLRFVSRCRRPFCLKRTFPPFVFLNRFAVDLFVFIFGITFQTLYFPFGARIMIMLRPSNFAACSIIALPSSAVTIRSNITFPNSL